MKTKKIRNVDRDVCVAEQKIAYNMAFRAHINYGTDFKKIECEAEKSHAVMKIRDALFKEYRNSYNYKPGKYNEDAIFVALNQGLRAYLDKPFLASTYKDVGRAFPIPYGVN